MNRKEGDCSGGLNARESGMTVTWCCLLVLRNIVRWEAVQLTE